MRFGLILWQVQANTRLPLVHYCVTCNSTGACRPGNVDLTRSVSCHVSLPSVLLLLLPYWEGDDPL